MHRSTGTAREREIQALKHVRDTLVKSDYTLVVTADPEETLRLVLPGADGMELMKDFMETADVPVIFLSAYGQDQLVARAFDVGAADYLVKPFSPVELSARIRAALRRRETPEPSQPYVLGDLTVDYVERMASLDGHPVPLTDIEYRTLAELASNAGRVLTYEHLLRRVWRVDGDADVRPMRTAVSSLRRKLGDDAENPHIVTEIRVGYRMPKGERGRGERQQTGGPHGDTDIRLLTSAPLFCYSRFMVFSDRHLLDALS